MMREGKAFCALATFYKYAKLLGYQRKRPKNRRKKHEKGLRASAPAEWLHLDVTIFRPLDHSKVFIYLLVDNFSRFILSATASTDYSAHTCLGNLKNGMAAYPEQLQKEQISLLTDGGSENQGVFRDFTQNTENLEQFIAQRDIHFSNSMVESSNQQLKYQYLFCREYADFEAVKTQLPAIIDSYNHKPHGALYGLTPAEAFLEGKIPDRNHFKTQKELAKQERLTANKAQNCKICQPL